MAYTCSAAAVSGGKTTVTGSGYAGASAILAVSFISADGKRKYVESYTVPVVAGAISYPVAVPYAGGTVTVKATDTAAAVIATASSLSV